MHELKRSVNRPGVGGMLLQQIIVFAICVVFPGLVTSIIPAAWLKFERGEAEVRCTIRTCVVFIVPYKTEHVHPVKGIDQRVREGRTERQRKLGRTTDKVGNVQSEGCLQTQGLEDQFIEVSV